MGVYRKGGKWCIDYYFQGRRIREVAGLTKEQAQKALSVRQAEIYQGKFKIQDAKPSPRFEEFAKQFLEWSRTNKRSWLRDESLVAHLGGVPGVDAAGVTTGIPTLNRPGTVPLLVEGVVSDQKVKPWAAPRQVSREFFDVLRLPVVAGRSFSETDLPGTYQVKWDGRDRASIYPVNLVDADESDIPVPEAVSMGESTLSGMDARSLVNLELTTILLVLCVLILLGEWLVYQFQEG